MNKLAVLPLDRRLPRRRPNGGMRCIALLSILPLVISGCDKITTFTQRITDNASATSGTSSLESTTNTGPTDNATTNQPANQSAQPVNYPFMRWQAQPVTKLTLTDINAINQRISQQFGKAPKTDTTSLDFNSNLATQYQFANPATPYFDVIDSAKFVEIAWYYPNTNDHIREQQLGINYAGYVYQLARGWLGSREGGKLVEHMLMGQTVRNQTINGVGIAIAKCEFFSCMLVLKK